ncbi:MAG: DUF4253 domain-containing protein [Mobilicoccus sp.]|nr:DUF4253 domain-containing protein [Mobilicoccus sp.]
MLVPTSRPADALLTLGPDGFDSRPDVATLTAVLRSWEERFGALPLWYSADTLDIALRRPPSTRAEALAFATEISVICPDALINTDLTDPEGIDELVGLTLWQMWWD